MDDLPQNFLDWNINQVHQWMKLNNLDLYSDQIRNLKFDGFCLGLVEDENDLSAIKFESVIHRKKMMILINQLRNNLPKNYFASKYGNFSIKLNKFPNESLIEEGKSSKMLTTIKGPEIKIDAYNASTSSNFQNLKLPNLMSSISNDIPDKTQYFQPGESRLNFKNIPKLNTSFYSRNQEDVKNKLILKAHFFDNSLAKEYIIEQRDCTIGRAQNNTIILKENTVSSQHALINKNLGYFAIKDLGSTTGTYVFHYHEIPCIRGISFIPESHDIDSEIHSEFIITKVNNEFGKLTMAYKSSQKNNPCIFYVYKVGAIIGKHPDNLINFSDDPILPEKYLKIEYKNNQFYAGLVDITSFLKIRLSPEHYESEYYKLQKDDIIKIGKSQFYVMSANIENNLLHSTTMSQGEFNLGKSLLIGNLCIDCCIFPKAYNYSCGHHNYCKTCLKKHPICEVCKFTTTI